MTDERLRPFIPIHLSDEGVPEVNEHPGDSHDAVESDEGLAYEQGDPHALEQRRNPPHVYDSGSQLLAQAELEGEEW